MLLYCRLTPERLALFISTGFSSMNAPLALTLMVLLDRVSSLALI
jgi:hypothetical protein